MRISSYNRFLPRLACLGLLVGLALSAVAGPSAPLPPKPQDWRAIQGTIARQIDAFRRDDATTAFSYAAPSVRKQFRTPHEFMRMVRAGYRAVYRPRAFRFLDPFTVSGQAIQPLEVVTQDDAVMVAYYVMEHQPDRTWKIAACALKTSAARAV